MIKKTSDRSSKPVPVAGIVKKPAVNVVKKPAVSMEKETGETSPENPVYFRIRSGEALDARRSLLLMELSFLTALKTMKRYNLWRKEELRIKSEIYAKIKEMRASLEKTKDVFPFLEIPERFKRRQLQAFQEFQAQEKAKKEEEFDSSLEAQLRDVQSRLRNLGK